MIDPNRTLDAARDVLARAKDLTPKPNVRLLRRFEQKIRLTEGALAAARAAPKGATTGAGLRAVLARAEARTDGSGASPEQARAIDALRAQIANLESEGPAGSEKLAALVESLAADVELMRKETAPQTKPRTAPKPPEGAKKGPLGKGPRLGGASKKKQRSRS